MDRYVDALRDDRYVVFLFHGVIPEHRHAVRNYVRKHIEAEYFARVIDGLCARGNPVSMAQIVDAHAGKRQLPSRAFAVTFDDGFENNHSVAAPLLRERGVPAMFYVTTSFVGADGVSWIDQVEFTVETCQNCELGDDFWGLGGSYPESADRIALLDRVRALVKSEPRIDPYDFAGELAQRLGVGAFVADDDLDRKLSWSQVSELAADPLFMVGGHSHTHRILDFLGQADLEAEIEISVGLLNAHLESPVSHYAYPEGQPNCYSQRVIDVLQRHGIVCSPSAIEGDNSIGDDLFHLRRIMVT